MCVEGAKLTSFVVPLKMDGDQGWDLRREPPLEQMEFHCTSGLVL
ncbi:hypothetical protein RE6C_02527 [Rhodopirellula europaea 6C]|uniref:Uncharacterized protein n=1 Tax=Rhodopirellula europaea 6C TaxID=1263867 RepID=M2AVG1_9BACT|nr:hypothetical protein RE6C_02527 [Rhodopirellula europaea 6C]